MIRSAAIGGDESRMADVVTTGRKLILLVAVLFGMLPGCAGRDAGIPAGKNFTKDQLSRFVLRSSDLPSTFKKVTSGTGSVDCTSPQLANYGAPLETPGEAANKQQLLALGPQSCHLSMYNKEDSSRGFRALAIVFPTAEAASAALPLLRKPLSDPLLAESYAPDPSPTPATDLPNRGLGDESLPGIKRSTPGPAPDPPGRPVTIDHIWRVRNVAVTLASTYDPLDDLHEADVDRIARNISARAVG